MIRLIVLLAVTFVIDIHAMELRLLDSDSIPSRNSAQLDIDFTDDLYASDFLDSDQLLKKQVNFSLGSISSTSDSLSPRSTSSTSSTSSTDLSIKKSSKKKKVSQEQKAGELLRAMKKNNTQEIMSLLHPNLNCADDEKGWTPLIYAIRNSNDSIIQDLLSHKHIDINQADKLGNTPLHHAVFQKDVTIIITLLHDPRVYSLFRNANNYMANQFIDDQSPLPLFNLRSLFFIRGRLDTLVDREMDNIKKVNKGIINQIVCTIMESIANDAKKQESYQELPKDTQLTPDVQFIKQIIIHRLPKHICISHEVENHTNKIGIIKK